MVKVHKINQLNSIPFNSIQIQSEMENDDIIEQPFDEEEYMDFEYAVEDDDVEQKRFDRWSARHQRSHQNRIAYIRHNCRDAIEREKRRTFKNSLPPLTRLCKQSMIDTIEKSFYNQFTSDLYEGYTLNASEIETLITSYKHIDNVYNVLQKDNIWVYAFVNHMIREAGTDVMARKYNYKSTDAFERDLYENPQSYVLDVQCGFNDIKMFWHAFVEWMRQTFKNYSSFH
jgi:hypothetical protein